MLGGCGTGRTSLLLASARSHRAQSGASTSTSSGSRRRLSAFSRRFAPRRRSRVRRTSTPRRARRRRATRSTRRSPFSIRRARPAIAPATFLLDEFLELRTFESFPACAASCATSCGARVQRQPVRADEPLRRARAPAAARRAVAVRDHPRRAAVSRRSPRDAAGGHADEAGEMPDAEELDRERDELARHRAGALRRPPGLRAGDRRNRDSAGAARQRRSRQRAGRAARARRPSSRGVPLLLRAPAPPRARLRRAQGDPRRARRSRSR